MTASNYDKCFTFTVGEEGLYSGDQNDPGNWTSGVVGTGTLIGSKYGVTPQTLMSWLGKGTAVVTPDYMKNLSLDVAKAIYGSVYWNRANCDSLPSGIDASVFDFGVNAGMSRSVKGLQTAVGLNGKGIDGWVGPVTLAAIAKMDWATLIDKLITTNEAYYHSLPTFARYGRGWIARQHELKAFALSLRDPLNIGTKVAMQYKFGDRLKEWTTYAGVVTAGLAAVIPQLVPLPAWGHIWQAAQLFLGGAMVFIPQTAGTTAVENDALQLLRAWVTKLPAAYAAQIQPVIAQVTSMLVAPQIAPVVPQVTPVVPPVAPVVPTTTTVVVAPPAS